MGTISSNEYPQSMFWSKNLKNSYTPVNPSLSIHNSRDSRGYTFHGHVFLMWFQFLYKNLQKGISLDFAKENVTRVIKVPTFCYIGSSAMFK